MVRRPRRLVLLLPLVLAAALPAQGHSASRGLHLHLSPQESAPGEVVDVEVDAARALVRLRIGFVDASPVDLRPEEPRRRIVVKLRVPESATDAVIGVQAEGETDEGGVLRAASVLRLRHPSPED